MFLKNFAKIKPTIIAKENNIDYANVIQNKGKESNLKRLEKEVKKRLAVISLIENLSPREIEAFKNLKFILENINSIDNDNFLNFIDIENIYIVYNIFKDFIGE